MQCRVLEENQRKAKKDIRRRHMADNVNVRYIAIHSYEVDKFDNFGNISSLHYLVNFFLNQEYIFCYIDIFLETDKHQNVIIRTYFVLNYTS